MINGRVVKIDILLKKGVLLVLSIFIKCQKLKTNLYIRFHSCFLLSTSLDGCQVKDNFKNELFRECNRD